jgi:hypothetical protein
MALEVFAHASTVAAALFAALAPVSVVGLGLAPRVGPARAIALALTSRLRAAATVSQRAADVRALQTSLRCAEADQYIIVFGPKGVGKTCVVETATQRTCGVVSVRVAAGAPSDAIARQALSAIARVQLAAAFVDVLPSARRVIFWHRLLAGRPMLDHVIARIGPQCAALALNANGDPARFATHGLLSGPAPDRITRSQLEEVVVTNTIPLKASARACEKITQLTVAPLLAQAISRVHHRQSVSDLFKKAGKKAD